MALEKSMLRTKGNVWVIAKTTTRAKTGQCCDLTTNSQKSKLFDVELGFPSPLCGKLEKFVITNVDGKGTLMFDTKFYSTVSTNFNAVTKHCDDKHG